MSGKVEIDREALLAAANQLSNWGKTVMAAPLWEALAAPVVERQEPVFMKPQYLTVKGLWIECGESDPKAVAFFASPPAPVALVLPDRKPEGYIVIGDKDVIDMRAKGWNACLEKVKELNQ